MKIVKLTGTIELLSGLHIGGGDDTMKIGGIDNGVIKDVNTDKPYIPGSSLKGKMRSLLEWHYGLVGFSDGNPFSAKYMGGAFPKEREEKAIILMQLFGSSVVKDDEKVLKERNIDLGITRISVGDCKLIEKKGEIVSEAKYENVIDRQNGMALNPRQTERVPSGVKFEFNIRVKVLDDKEEESLKNMVEKGLNLVEDDYLGGSGSRGYGRVQFIDRKWE